MNDNESFNRKRTFSFCEAAIKKKEQKEMGAERLRKKSFCDNHFVFRPVTPKPLASPLPQKKILQMKNHKDLWNPRKPKKHFSKKDQPHTPHNTTQFILNAVNLPTETNLQGFDDDRFEYDFQHHAMAGSMMELMERKLILTEQRKSSSDDKEHEVQAEQERPEKMQEDDYGGLKVRSIKSTNDIEDYGCLLGLGRMNSYQQLIDGTNSDDQPLQEVVKELVAVLKKKDDQIDLLRSLSHNSKSEAKQA